MRGQEDAMIYRDRLETVPRAIRDDAVWHRMDLHTQIMKSLLTIIPRERGFSLREEEASSSVCLPDLLDNPPMPEVQNTGHALRITHHAVPHE